MSAAPHPADVGGCGAGLSSPGRRARRCPPSEQRDHVSEGPTGRTSGPGAHPRPSAGTDDQAELLRRSAGGDEAAFAQLYDATCTKLFGLVVRLTRSPELAAEVRPAAVARSLVIVAERLVIHHTIGVENHSVGEAL